VASTTAECTDLAFRSNALVIHYVTNDHLVQPDEMVLFDGGCEYKFREPICRLSILVLTVL
jgi:Xaa-Pro aminopeptidase